MAVMTINKHDKPLPLGQIQDILNVPQHVLIHLCEKEVILPDFSDTKGRGQSRLFSKRNLLEFAIALHIRQFQIPVMATRVIILVLRKFEEKVQKKIKDFTLESMAKTKLSPKLILYIVTSNRKCNSFVLIDIFKSYIILRLIFQQSFNYSERL